MSRITYIIIALIVLAAMESVSWTILKSSEETSETSETGNQGTLRQDTPQDWSRPEVLKPEISSSVSIELSGAGDADSDSFPPPTTEVKNGRTERTIHMGVRQYAWDPSVIMVKRGELVRLIMHNADVQHGLVIPELGVLNIDIPPEGAVIEFVPEKTGTFVFFCSYYCGEGHSEMRGKIVVE